MLDGTASPPDLATFQQRKREVKCAVLLAAKLDTLKDDGEEEFVERARVEARGLAESPLGGTLLELVGSAYVDQARAELSLWDGLLIGARQQVGGVGEFWCNIATTAQAAVAAVQLNGQQRRAEARQARQDDAAGVPPEEREERKKRTGLLGGAALGPGPGASPEEREAFRESTKNVTSHV